MPDQQVSELRYAMCSSRRRELLFGHRFQQWFRFVL
jgi:hypothetical protein